MNRIDKFFKLLEFLAAIILGFLVIMVFLNVALRYSLGTGIVVNEELSRILLIWMVFIGSTVALYQGSHIKMTMFVSKFSPSINKVFIVVGCVLMLWCDYLLIKGSFSQVKIGMMSKYPISGLPTSITMIPAFLAGIAFAIITIAKTIRLLK